MSDVVNFSKGRVLGGLGLVAMLLAGCATQVAAPVRDGSITTPSAAAAAAPPPASGVHVVRPGETLMGIARQYGLNVRDLVAWNSFANPNQLAVGQQVRLAPPGDAVTQPIAIAQPVEIQPVLPAGSEPAAPTTIVKIEPKGGRQPYSDEAWAALNPRPTPPAEAPSAPAAAAQAQDTVWLWPASGSLIATYDEATNKGVDIAGNPGDPVLASAAGTVMYSGSGLRGYGKLIIIKHDANYLTAYAHNRELLVKEGDSVAKGQKIAELGSTDADRPKLHFEIRKQGRPVDPMKYLPAR